jgi:hypothetical protein
MGSAAPRSLALVTRLRKTSAALRSLAQDLVVVGVVVGVAVAVILAVPLLPKAATPINPLLKPGRPLRRPGNPKRNRQTNLRKNLLKTITRMRKAGGGKVKKERKRKSTTKRQQRLTQRMVPLPLLYQHLHPPTLQLREPSRS